MTLDEAVALLRGTTLIQDGTQLGEARALVLAVVERAQVVGKTEWGRYVLGEES